MKISFRPRGVGLLALAAAVIALASLALATRASRADDPTTPTITLKQVDKKGCKIFSVSVQGQRQAPVAIQTISVVDFNKDLGSVTSNDFTFTTKNNQPQKGEKTSFIDFGKASTRTDAWFTVCPKLPIDKGLAFDVTATTTDGGAKTVDVREEQSKGDKSFEVKFAVEKTGITCPTVGSGLVIDNLTLDEGYPKCDEKRIPGFTVVTVKGTKNDPNAVATALLTIDPPGQTFLLVGESLPRSDEVNGNG